MDPLTRKVRPVKHRKRKKPLSEEIQSMYRLLSATLIVLIVASTVGLLALNSQRSAKGYTLKQLQLTNEELESDKRNIDHQLMEAQSIGNIETDGQLINHMEVANNNDFSYVNEDSNFAQNE